MAFQLSDILDPFPLNILRIVKFKTPVITVVLCMRKSKFVPNYKSFRLRIPECPDSGESI